MDGLERKVGNKALPLAEILDAFVRPFVTQVRKSELSEKLFYKLMGRIFGDEAGKIPAAVEQDISLVVERFMRAFKKALAGVPEEDLVWRLHFTVGSMIHMMAHAESLQRITRGASGHPSMEQTVSRFIRFAASGMSEGWAEKVETKAKGPQGEFHF